MKQKQQTTTAATTTIKVRGCAVQAALILEFSFDQQARPLVAAPLPSLAVWDPWFGSGSRSDEGRKMEGAENCAKLPMFVTTCSWVLADTASIAQLKAHSHSLLHSFTPSLLHSFTPSLLHYFTHYFTPSLTLILIFSLLETHAAEWETELHGTRDSALWTHFLQG